MLHEAHRVHVYHSQREGLSVGQSSSSMSERTGRSVGEQTGRPVRPSGQELNVAIAQIRTLLDRQRQKRCTKTRWNYWIPARRTSFERLLQQNSELREAHYKSLNEMEELKKFQSSTFDTIARRRLVEDQKDFQDAESIRSGNSHVTSRPVSFPPHPIPGGMLSHSVGMPSRREGPPSIWDTQGISGNVSANPDASSSAPYPQELNPWSSSTEEPLHSSTVEMSERQAQDQDPRCLLDSQPKILSSSVEETLQRIMGQTNNDCRFQIFILTNSLHQSRLLAGR